MTGVTTTMMGLTTMMDVQLLWWMYNYDVCILLWDVTNYEEYVYFCVEWGRVHLTIHYIHTYTTHAYTHTYIHYIHTYTTHAYTLHIHSYIHMTTLLLWWCVTTMMMGLTTTMYEWTSLKQTASALGVRRVIHWEVMIPSNLTRSILLLVYVSLNHPSISSMSYVSNQPSFIELYLLSCDLNAVVRYNNDLKNNC